VAELGVDVFVGKTSDAKWEPDTDPPGEVQILCEGVGLEAGFWRSVPGTTPQPARWTLPSREVVFVLEGTARIEIEDGPTVDLKAGDVASMPKGAMTTWHLSPDFKELWVLAPVA
jgi:uncharacterized cupin superfamily protein